MKEITFIRILISIIGLILSSLSLFNVIDVNISISMVMALLLGILTMSSGYSSYTKDKKIEAIILILCGIFMMFVFVSVTFFK